MGEQEEHEEQEQEAMIKRDKEMSLRPSFLDAQLWYQLPTYAALAGKNETITEERKNQIIDEMCEKSDEEKEEERDVEAKLRYLRSGVLEEIKRIVDIESKEMEIE